MVHDPSIDDPVQDIINEEVTPPTDTANADPFESDLIQLKTSEQYDDISLIDEPVTGAGNDDLWIKDVECEEGNCEQANDDETADNQSPEIELEPAE